MSENSRPGRVARRLVLRQALAIGAGAVAAFVAVRISRADDGPAIRVDNFAFLPQVLRVKAGTTVTWTNHDDIPHSIVCPALQLRSHPMDTDGTFGFKFDAPGTYSYVCGLHPFMHGQVVVT